MARTVLILVFLIAQAGCGGDARVELAAADSIDGLAANLAEVLTEYHTDLERSDDTRERAAVDAFVNRVRADVADDGKVEAHTEAFLQALERVRADRQVEWRRHTASMDNVSTLGELARGLRRMALESLSLEDEARRYFDELLERRRTKGSPRDREAAP